MGTITAASGSGPCRLGSSGTSRSAGVFPIHCTGVDRISRQAWKGRFAPRFRFTRASSGSRPICLRSMPSSSPEATIRPGYTEIQGAPFSCAGPQSSTWWRANGGHGQCPASPQPRCDASGSGQTGPLTIPLVRIGQAHRGQSHMAANPQKSRPNKIAIALSDGPSLGVLNAKRTPGRRRTMIVGTRGRPPPTRPLG